MSVPEDAGDGPDASVTRVYVSGLPPSVTKEQLRTHFSAKGKFSVTDAHVIPDRRIGFIGFASHEHARSAARYFDRSFVRMSKISVTLARPVEVQREKNGVALPVSERGAKRRKLNAQDDSNVKRQRPERPETAPAKSADVVEEPLLPETLQTNAEEESSAPEPRPNNAEESNGTEGPRSDGDWLRGKTSRILDLVDDTEWTEDSTAPTAVTSAIATATTDDFVSAFDPEPDTSQADREDEATKAETKSVEVPMASVPNARLFIRNLPFDTHADELRSVFAAHGRISDIHLVTDTKTLKGKGLGYIQFVEPTDAATALSELDGKDFQGRLLHILPASDKKSQKLSDFEISKLPLKQQKAIKRKNEASTSTFSWNSLYMNPDAVLASVANRLGVTKADLLDPSSSDAAVKQAHAETSVLKETKDYLRSSGLNVQAFTNRTRDDSTLLLKNFSYGTTSDELSTLLSQYGRVKRLLFPPTGTMAVVQFYDPAQATLALKQLAYRNLKGSVLFLEKAPSGIWDTPVQLASNDPGLDVPETVISTTVSVFVRNLNFSTTSARLTDAFKPLSGFLSARVKTRTDPGRPGEILSMGFGFVEFRTRSQAEAAIATMNGRTLDGHELLVQASQKATDLGEEKRKEDNAKKLNSARTKVVIKNLPFEATKKDVRALFGAYGQLRTVRMPKKFDNTARGFAFAEFLTTKEAESAIDALSNTHLLGRRLVLDFAEGEIIDPEAEIQAMEKKVQGLQDTLTHQKMTGSVRKKFNVDAREDFDPLG